LEMLAELSHTVLLFTQNVLSVSVLHIPDGGNPRKPRMLFKVTKKLAKIVRKWQHSILSMVLIIFTFRRAVTRPTPILMVRLEERFTEITDYPLAMV